MDRNELRAVLARRWGFGAWLRLASEIGYSRDYLIHVAAGRHRVSDAVACAILRAVPEAAAAIQPAPDEPEER